MAFRVRSLGIPALALSVGVMLASNAQALPRHHHYYHYAAAQHHRVWRGGDHLVSRGDDVVVHTGRSYLDPGPSANEGTENRYFYDTAHYDMREEGPAFTANNGGFENLP